MIRNNEAAMLAAMLLLSGCGGGEPAMEAGVSAGVLAPPTSVVVASEPASTPTPTPAAKADQLVYGVATHFQQGWPVSALETARTLGAATIRDGVSWKDVETTPGKFNFNAMNTRYLDEAARTGVSVTIVLYWGNPLYDQGYTPYTDEGRAAFGRFAVAILDRFPAVRSIEIGNEFNAQNFVSGPVKAAPYSERQAYYAKIQKAVFDAVKARHPTIQILGGAAHAIPVGYLKTLFDIGGLDTMDGLVIHPYTTEPEQFGKQIALLREAMGSKERPIHATEFARELDSEVETADYLVKMTTVLSETKIASAGWYALRQQGPEANPWYKRVALSLQDGSVTPVGRGYKMMAQNVLPRGSARRVAIDDFTYGYLFGDRTMVLWGEPRDLTVDGSAKFFNSRGEEIPRPARIAADSPIVIVAAAPILYGRNLRLGASSLIADSFDQFDYSNSTVKSPTPGRWSYYDFNAARQVLEPLSGFGGGEISSGAWTPYVSDAWRRPLAIAAESLIPANFGTAAAPKIYGVVARYTFDQEQRVRIEATWTVNAASTDGTDLTIFLNDKVVDRRIVTGTYLTDLRGLAVRRGDRLDFRMGPNVSASGDTVRYRIKIRRD